MNRLRFFLYLLLPCIGLFAAACSNDNPLASNPAVTVMIAPHVAKIYPGDTVHLSATVTGAADSSVTWSVGYADIQNGTLLPDGRYIAPDSITGQAALVTIRAIAKADTTSSDEATILVQRRPDTPSIADPVQPGVGTGYIYSTSRLDSLKQPVPGSEQTESYTVVRKEPVLNGKNDVTILRYDGDGLPIAYEVNGDLSIYTDGNWMTLPFGSRASVVIEDFDTTYSDGATVSRAQTATYAGSEPMTIAGQKLLTYKVVLTSTRKSVESSGSSFVSRSTADLWFAPAIGWMTRIDEWSVSINSSGTYPRGNSSVLTSYTLK